MQVTGPSQNHVAVQLVERGDGITLAEIIPPTPKVAVHVLDQIRDRDKATLRTHQFAKLVASAGLSLRRRQHMEIAIAPPALEGWPLPLA